MSNAEIETRMVIPTSTLTRIRKLAATSRLMPAVAQRLIELAARDTASELATRPQRRGDESR